MERFTRTDLAHFKARQLMEAEQQENELPDAFMERIRPVTQEAFRKLADEEQKIMAVTAFCKGLRKRQLAALVSAQARESISKPVGISYETESNLEQQTQSGRPQKTYRPYRDKTRR